LKVWSFEQVLCCSLDCATRIGGVAGEYTRSKNDEIGVLNGLIGKETEHGVREFDRLYLYCCVRLGCAPSAVSTRFDDGQVGDYGDQSEPEAALSPISFCKILTSFEAKIKWHSGKYQKV
jgi:hypothetical protein